ncbi:TonB-dependent receptor [Sphingomonas gei]|uniref:TonB-dependent receptor n=1 Tax=Sphingomonas gei TaxID=1395960 RepID=A0A4S1WZG2_9SPHN|nr:TonB-dependent receptor [Sphingomonas gei]TGX48743.1 TonB-dependent receptor [Sphingomonas gei]
MRNAKLTFVASVIALASAMPAAAQSTDAAVDQSAADDHEGDIVVTARHREETAQSIPSTLNVFSAQALQRSGITSAFDIQSKTPNLSIAITDREVNVAIRGIGNNIRSIGADPSNAASLNGVYLPRAGSVLGQLYDIARVEVLKGPQGTLYGRNATGGAINVISAEPISGFVAEGYVGGGSFGMRRAQAAVSAGNDLIAVRIAGVYARDDGYTHNLIDGKRLDDTNYRGFRATAVLTPSADIKAMLFWQHSYDKSGLGYGGSLDPSIGSDPDDSYAVLVPPEYQRVDPRHIRVDYPTHSLRKGDVVGLNLDWALGAVGLRSITGYTFYGDRDSQDTDGTGLPIERQITSQVYRSYSQELQLFSKGASQLEWLAGLFLYGDEGREFLDYGFNLAAIPAVDYQSAALLRTTAKSRSVAGFGQLTYHLGDQVSLIAGARYSHDWKRGTRAPAQTFALTITPLDIATSGDKFTPSLQLQWKPDANVMVYVGATQGYKNGGINSQDTIGRPVFGPEDIWSYEAGVKSQFLDRRITLNLSAFYMDYRGIQLRTAIVQLNSVVVGVTNDARAKIKGAELFVDAQLGSGLSLDFNGAYLDTDVSNHVSPTTGLPVSNRPLPLAPKWSGTAGVNYTGSVPGIGAISGRAEYNFRSTTIFPYTYDTTYNFDPPDGIVNATLRWTAPNGAFYVEGVGRNLTDLLYRINRGDNLPAGVAEAFASPRTIEARVGFKF